jgi:DNA-binding CsgD family transcriptional regulator
MLRMEAPALVGRREELEVLEHALERVLRGRSRIVVVTGDPGVGKTRLLAEYGARSRRRAIVLAGRGSPLSTSIPFATIAEALESHLRTLPPADVAALVGERAADLAQVLPSLPSSLRPAGPSAGRLAVLEALARTIGRLASDRPVLLLLDDLHRSDPSTWEVVGYLGRNPQEAPVLLVAALRRQEMDLVPDLARLVSTLVKDGLADELRLQPLQAGDVATLAERILGPAAVDAELGSWLFDRTRGNALYAVALLQELRGDPTRRVVPVSVKERVRMEVSDLSPGAAEALEHAAALGHSFPLRQLAMAIPDGSGAALDELVRRGLLIERGDPARVVFDFAHPLVQEAVYDGMGAGRRRQVHERLAEALAAEPLVVRAYHIARSALRGDRSAIQVLREAAAEAERSQSHREALSHLQAALEIVADNDPDRRRLLDETAWQAEQASDHTIGLPALRELAKVVPDDPAELGRTRMRIASALATGAADLVAAEREARAAIGAFERSAPERIAAGINELGWIHALGGDLASQEEACRRAVALAEERGDEQTVLHALGPLCHGLALRGRFQEAREIGARAVELARSTEDATQIGWHTAVHAMTFGLEGRFRDAAAVIDPLLAAGPSPSDVAYDNRAWINWFCGRWSLALEDCGSVRSLHPTAPSAHSAWALSIGAALHTYMGTPEEGRALLGQADRVYGDTDLYWFSAAHRWAAAHVAWIEGEAQRAADLFDHAAQWLRRCDVIAVECQILPDTVEALVDAGRTVDAASWARRAGEVARLLGSQLAEAVAAHTMGIVQGSHEHLRRAARSYEAIGAPPLQARALHRLGEIVRNGDRTADLVEAARLYGSLPAPVLADRVRAELRRRGSAGKRAAQSVGELTPREQQIAALARRGQATRQIAERLHLSERTVESHLARIYAKLGISGRKQLRARLGPRTHMDRGAGDG